VIQPTKLKEAGSNYDDPANLMKDTERHQFATRFSDGIRSNVPDVPCKVNFKYFNDDNDDLHGPKL